MLVIFNRNDATISGRSANRRSVVTPGPFLHPYGRPAAEPEAFIKIVRGEGAIVWDDLGNRYVDALASLWYCNLGHGNRAVCRTPRIASPTLDEGAEVDRTSLAHAAISLSVREKTPGTQQRDVSVGESLEGPGAEVGAPLREM